MGPIAVNRFFRRARAGLAGMFAVLALSGVLLAHHIELPGHEEHHEAGPALTIDDYLGAFVALGAAVVAVAVGLIACATPRLALVPLPAERFHPPAPVTSARAGPPGLTQRCTWRI